MGEHSEHPGDLERFVHLPVGAAKGAKGLSEETAQRLIGALERSRPVKGIRNNAIASGIVGTIGFALFVVGVERAADDIPVLSSAWGSIVAGLVLLAAAGALLRRLVGD